jgi:iron complex outermembrane recepter protein
VGMKAQFFDRRLQADLAAFITDFDNYQANFTQLINGAQVTNLINAGSVTSRGVSADLIAKATKELTLTANLAYDDAHVVNFPCPVNAAISCNINGKPLPFAPEWKMHLQADYRRPVSARLDIDLETDYNWQSKTQYQLTQTPNTIQPSYGVWNASVGLINSQDGWSARLLVKNITDQHYSPFLGGGNIGGLVRWVPRDDNRYFGVNLHKDF